MSSNSRQKGKHFNSQPHEEADCVIRQTINIELNFNSQPHEEADLPPKVSIISNTGNFNSQPHEEADSKFR